MSVGEKREVKGEKTENLSGIMRGKRGMDVQVTRGNGKGVFRGRKRRKMKKV